MKTKQISHLTPRQQHIASLILLVIVSLIFFKKSPLDEPSETTNTSTKMSTVTYMEVPSGRYDVKRFVAMSTSNESMSIKSWMSLVSSKSTGGITAAMDLSDIIASSEYESLLFETMGTSWSTCETTAFEFALVNRPGLKHFAEGLPDRNSFDEHFSKCRRDNMNAGNAPTVCSFGNLGGDARLVSPIPQQDISDANYSHLAVFVRNAPKSQISEFWALAAARYLKELEKSAGKRWFSTNGMGVAWLHLRLDTRPKYYSYEPFTR